MRRGGGGAEGGRCGKQGVDKKLVTNHGYFSPVGVASQGREYPVSEKPRIEAKV
jgi:hypothetical protein